MKHDFALFAELIVLAALLILVILMITSGCMSAGKATYKYIDDLTGTPYPTPTPTAQITRIPDRVELPVALARTESPEEYRQRTNGRDEKEIYSFFRTNVTGSYQDMYISTTVYGHKFLNEYHTWSDSWAEYFRETPAPGYQFLVIYAVVWVDTEKGDDVRPYGFDMDHWRVQYNGHTYEPYKYYDPAWRVKELENVPNYNDNSYIGPYGYSLRYTTDHGWVADPLGWIKGGKSNAWDGYLIYEIPETATAGNTKVVGRFENLGGWAWWQLI